MPTNLEIDDGLLVRAKKLGNFKSKKETVNVALAEFIRRHEQKAVTELFGTVDFHNDFDPKKLRAKR